jgi:release factor glutamine methyltransferase
MTDIRGLLTAAARVLAGGAEDPAVEAQILLAHVLERDRGWLYARPEHVPAPAQRRAFERLLARRRDGEPIAYLTGCREFWSLPLKVTPATLIPRPETEHLVEAALALGLPTGARVVDLGTGSGAVALALAHERNDWSITATDISPDALAIAAENARQLGLSRVDFRGGDWFDALPPSSRFGAIFSNPPYVADEDPHLTQGDLRFEPRNALAAGPEGLDTLRRLISGAPAFLQPAGWLWVEHGAEQGRQVRALFKAAGFVQTSTRRDLAGLERCSGGQHAPS